MPEKPKTLDDAVVQTLELVSYLKGKSAAVVSVAEVAAIRVCQDLVMEMLQLLVERMNGPAWKPVPVTPVRKRNPPGSRQGSSDAQLSVTSVERKTNLRGDVLLAANLDHRELDTLSAVERATEGDHLQCQNQGWFTTSLLAVNPVCAYHVVGSIYGVMCALCCIRGQL